MPGKSTKVTDEPITEITDNVLHAKQGQFKQEKVDEIQTKIKNRKAACPDEISSEVGKIRKFDDGLL